MHTVVDKHLSTSISSLKSKQQNLEFMHAAINFRLVRSTNIEYKDKFGVNGDACVYVNVVFFVENVPIESITTQNK